MNAIEEKSVAMSKRIRRANATRAILSNQEKKDHNLAVMLLVVVVVFFLCNVLALVSNVLEQFVGIETFDGFDQIIQVSNLLVTINSSVNILIYCIFGAKFKSLFMQIFCRRKGPSINDVRKTFGISKPPPQHTRGHT